MTASLLDPDPREPLALTLQARPSPPAFPGATCRRIEFSSRGDRVPARLLTPAAPAGPLPIVLLQHGMTGHKESEYLDVAARWVAEGVAVATIDFPLHGERSSDKLSERLFAAVRSGNELDSNSRLLWSEFGRQAVLDLRRCVDALETLAELDTTRLAYAGFSLGSLVGSVFCASDPRPRSAALALVGGGFGPPTIDPASHVAAFAPRPLLVVAANDDEVISRKSTEIFYAAAREPKQIEWFDGTHGSLPGRALKAMWQFSRRSLALD